jgi:hypothetical protein
MTGSTRLNDVGDNEEPASLEKSASTRAIESPEGIFEISSDDPSVKDPMNAPGDIDWQLESHEDESVAKEYTPPLPAWKLFTIVVGCVYSVVHEYFSKS